MVMVAQEETPMHMESREADDAVAEAADETTPPSNSSTRTRTRTRTIHVDNIHTGSTIGGAIFNFTNSIIGAGAIGLGGAIAKSGGIISVVAILSFAILTKLSLDMVIDLSIGSSYEELGRNCYGIPGWSAVLISKMLYAFGCLVAYIVVVKDNFGSALGHLISVDFNDTVVTLALSTFVMLPLCLLRDMTPLSNLSMISVASMMVIVAIVLYLYFDNPNDIREHGGSVYENWFQVRSGLLESLGTFVFSFVSQHTVHLAFESLQPQLQTIQNWKRISSWSIALSTLVSLSVGVFVYMTFWEHAGSDVFDQYPALPIVDVAKLLLCITMLLTFPFPFFTCRDMIIVAATAMILSFSNKQQHQTNNSESSQEQVTSNDLEEPLLQQEQKEDTQDIETTTPEPQDIETTTPELDSNLLVQDAASLPSWLIADRQLKSSVHHISVTVALWAVTTTLALVAPNLGDVLNLVGCATGTVIAFILPSLFYFKQRGYSHTAMILVTVGGLVGSVGTFFSTKQLFLDSR